jgi:hypothetical protein
MATPKKTTTPKATAKATSSAKAAPTTKKTTTKPVAEVTPPVVETEKPVKKIVRKSTVKNPVAPSILIGKFTPTDADIAYAAYLNYLNRLEKGIPGDANGDWLDAVNRFAA